MGGIVGSSPNMKSGVVGMQPNGVSRSIGFLSRENSSSSNTGTLGGTGLRIVPFTHIRDGMTGGKWTNPILTLSSNYWTMEVGTYWWIFQRAAHQVAHQWVLGIRTYGDAAGSGSSLSNITTAGINLGHNMDYCSSGTNGSVKGTMFGVLEVSSKNQKHGFYQYTEQDSALGSSAFGASSSQIHLCNLLMFQKISDEN